MNIHEKSITAPHRPKYVHQEYPKAMYHASHPARIAKDEADELAAREFGWDDKPAPKAAEPKPEDKFQAQIAELEACRDAKAGESDKLRARIAELEAERDELESQIPHWLPEPPAAAPEPAPKAPKKKA